LSLYLSDTKSEFGGVILFKGFTLYSYIKPSVQRQLV
jgi:hypothetical protein